MVSGGTRWCHCLDKLMHATSTSIAHLHNPRAPIYLRSQNCFLMNQCASLERIIRRPLVWGGRGQNGRQTGLSASQRVRGAGWVGGFCDFWHSQYYKIGILLDCSTPETPMSQYFNGSGQRKRTFWVDCNEIHISNLDVNQRLPRHPYEGIGSLGNLRDSGVLESQSLRVSGVSGVSESRECYIQHPWIPCFSKI